MIDLREVDGSTVEQCAALKCTDAQRQFANSPIWTLLQAAYDAELKDKCKVYAIMDDEAVVGMVRLDFAVFPDYYELTNLLIHAEYQRKNFATAAMQKIIDIFAADGKHRTIRLHVAKDNTAAIHLYEKAEFQHCPAQDDEWFDTYEYHIE